LPDSPHLTIISKNPGLPALHLAGRNEFRFSFNKYKKMIFFIFGCWHLPEKFSLCPTQGATAPHSLLARTPTAKFHSSLWQILLILWRPIL